VSVVAPPIVRTNRNVVVRHGSVAGPDENDETSPVYLIDLTGDDDDVRPSQKSVNVQTHVDDNERCLASSGEIVVPDEAPSPTVEVADDCVANSGGRLERYTLGEKLGAGSFGCVFLAHDTNLDRDVALKVLDPAYASNPEVLQRFIVEARAAARVRHPGVVVVHDCGQAETNFGVAAYIAMEILDGESLTARLKRSGALAADTAIEITRQIASALSAAHRVNVLHRDLKPDNIYLVSDPAIPAGERIKVLDFGLAKIQSNVGQVTHQKMIFGTPRYMSPEQCRSSGEVDQRSDIYSLGCILFELVCGRPPFEGDYREVMGQHLKSIPRRARSIAPNEISSALDDLIASMLAKDPGERPQTMGAVLKALYDAGAVAPGASATMLPIAASAIALPEPDDSLSDTNKQPAGMTTPGLKTGRRERHTARIRLPLRRRHLVSIAAAALLVAGAAIASVKILSHDSTPPPAAAIAK
jgi:serine/threonine-protein kinase